jgi:thioesterase domain-containing protein
VAYTVPRPDRRLAWEEVRGELARLLPSPLVPAAMVVLPELPLTASGKVDRRALPAAELGDAGVYVAPRDLLELGVARIWEELLGRWPIGVRQRFFDLGGHSLLAVRLMARIESAYGGRLRLDALFANPTVETLAGALRERGGAARTAALVELQEGAGRAAAPLVFVHPAGGDVFCYGALARQLGPGRAFLAFRCPGLDGEGPPLASLEQLAARYLEQLQSRQPRGPYFLGGWSLGGMVAWEMARQLAERRERVAMVALLDTWALPAEGAGDTDAELLTGFARDLGLAVPAAAAAAAAGLGRDKMLDLLLSRARLDGVVPPDLEPARMHSLFSVFAANARAYRRYRPVPGGAPVKLWRAQRSLADASEPTLGWTVLARAGLEVFDVAGNHRSIVRDPQVQAVARGLLACLRAAEQESW